MNSNVIFWYSQDQSINRDIGYMILSMLLKVLTYTKLQIAVNYMPERFFRAVVNTTTVIYYIVQDLISRLNAFVYY